MLTISVRFLDALLLVLLAWNVVRIMQERRLARAREGGYLPDGLRLETPEERSERIAEDASRLDPWDASSPVSVVDPASGAYTGVFPLRGED